MEQNYKIVSYDVIISDRIPIQILNFDISARCISLSGAINTRRMKSRGLIDAGDYRGRVKSDI